jgi:predicted metal-dependent peptidase
VRKYFYITERMASSPADSVENVSQDDSTTLPKISKVTRYYYKHREEILEKKKQKRLEDPEYQAKQKAKEEAKRLKEAEKLAKVMAKQAEKVAKVMAKESDKIAQKEAQKEERRLENKLKAQERGRERAKAKAERLGIQTELVLSGIDKNAI